MKLKLIHNLSKEEYILDVRDAGSTMDYFKFEFNLYENMTEGEYEYVLIDDNENEISNGLLQIGDYKQNNKQYSNKKTNIVYNG